MDDDELRSLMTRAAEDFPVRGGFGDVRQRMIRRRRVTVGLAAAIGAAVIVGLAVPAVVSGPATPVPAAGSAAYVGSAWRLTTVAQGSTTTVIPASVGAVVEFTLKGEIFIFDGVNSVTGSYVKSADGFDVPPNVISTAVGYSGQNPRRLAAITAMDTITGRSGQPGPAKDTVVSVTRTGLIIQAGPYRLTFERAGVAREPS
jgi:hypothetical protein